MGYPKLSNARPIFCLCFDDSFDSDYTVAFPILEELGIPAAHTLTAANYHAGHETSYPSAANQLSKAHIREMLATGRHHIAFHCYDHAKLLKVGTGGYPSAADLLTDVTTGVDVLRQEFGDLQPVINCVRTAAHTLDQDGAVACLANRLTWGGMATTGLGTSINPALASEHRAGLSGLARFRVFVSGPTAGTLPSTSPGVYPDSIRDVHWQFLMFHDLGYSPGTGNGFSAADFRAWIEHYLEAGVQFVTLPVLEELYFGNLIRPRHDVTGLNLQANGHMRMVNKDYPTNPTMRPQLPFLRGGGTINNHFFRSGGAISRDDGRECGYIRCEKNDTGVWWTIYCYISGPGVYDLKFQHKAGDAAVPVQYAIEGYGGNAQHYTDNYSAIVSATDVTPGANWAELTKRFVVKNAGHRRLAIKFYAKSTAGAGQGHFVSDLGVYKVR